MQDIFFVHTLLVLVLLYVLAPAAGQHVEILVIPNASKYLYSTYIGPTVKT